MRFNYNPLCLSDGYKPGHRAMLAPGTTRLYGTWIPRSLKHAPKGILKIVCAGSKLCWKEIHDAFEEGFFGVSEEEAMLFGKDMSLYLGMEYNAEHFRNLHKLGYLPVKVKSLPEGIETLPNIPHQTFINTVDGFGWLTLYLETPMSNLSWKCSTAATIALQYRRVVEKWVNKTDPTNAWLIPFLCHDFSARGLSGSYDMCAVGLGHAMSFRGSDTLMVIPASRYYYNEPKDEVCINSVNASEHSVSTTKIFTVGEKQMILDWLKEIPEGIFSMVADTFSLWEFIEYLKDPEIKAAVLSRNGKLVVRPDSGDPVDIICGTYQPHHRDFSERHLNPEFKGVIELLWDIFGGTINKQGFKVLDPHIGAIYGDSINLERQIQIYERLEAKGFAATNIVLGIGSFTYQFNTRDTFGWAAKGAWFEVENKSDCNCTNYITESCKDVCEGCISKKGYDIYKDPITDDGSKKSLKGRCAVFQDDNGEYFVKVQCTEEQEKQGLLQTIYEDGKFYNETTLTEIRERINKIV